MKIYITLNEDKDKDKTIIEYLNTQYSKSGLIKAMLYQLATNDSNMPVVGAITKEQNKPVKEVTKHQKVANNSNLVDTPKKLNLSEFL